MTAHPDPWAATDHDPSSHVQPAGHSAVISTTAALALARADIHDALAADGPARRQWARSARAFAAMVLQAPDATAAQRELAGYYLIDAAAFIANS
jgi:hypothetical protein